MRRTFSPKQRLYLSILSGGKCSACGVSLSDEFHADHIHPYSKGGETTLFNGQALCPKCNLSKGAKLVNTPALRSWQIEASEKLMDEFGRKTDDPKPQLIAASPGAGKTFFGAWNAKEKINDGTVDAWIVVAPSVNVKLQWVDEFEKLGIDACSKATNISLNYRQAFNEHPLGDWTVIVVTYSQLAKDKELFQAIAAKIRVGVIADEVHHADEDEEFGKALNALADEAKLKLSLSGTPFNTKGGALSMCPAEKMMKDGRVVRRTTPLVTYSYGDAIRDNACRPVEFVKVFGRNNSTYKSLANKTTFQKVIDLSNENKTDSIGLLLDPDGEFMEACVIDMLEALSDLKNYDKRSGALVVAKDKDHGRQLKDLIAKVSKSDPKWARYSFVEIYNDSPKAHDRITDLNRDSTDIVITVRMISEGVDVKRLKVGLYATNTMTRMFFIQFVGRLIRWEDRLDSMQHARIIIPAHIALLNYAREIEKMVDTAIMVELKDGEGDAPEKQNELLLSESQKTGDGLLYRGNEESDRELGRLFLSMHPSLLGYIDETHAAMAARDVNLEGSMHEPKRTKKTDWGKKNEQLVRAIVKFEAMDGERDKTRYSYWQKKANKAVGISKKDSMTKPDILKKRHEWLKGELAKLHNLEVYNG